MDKIKKKIIQSITLLFALLLLVTPFYGVLAEPGFDDQTYWSGICNTVSGYRDNTSKCDSYRVYLKDKQSETEDLIANLKSDVNKLSGDIEKDEALLKTVDAQIEALEKQISKSKQEIVAIESKIASLLEEIRVTEIAIEEKYEIAKKYMINIQSTTRVNVFVDFLLGGEDFAEISRRVEGMNRINDKNQENIRELNEEKIKLEEKKLDLDFQKKYMAEVLEEQQKSIKEQKELKILAEERIVILRAAYQEMLDKRNAAQQQQKAIVSKIDSIGPIETTQGGMYRPLNGGYYISASVWGYSGGGKHLGLDMAAPVGTPIVAPANGIVAATNTGCPTQGSLGSSCGGGYGNYIMMIVSSEGSAYGALYGHMQAGGVLVSVGNQIGQGQNIGLVGNSGSSTGSHVHAELFYLGEKSIQEAYDDWYNGSRNIQFGLGGSGWGNEYANRCDVKGMVPDCRMNPSNYWGLYVGNSR